MSHDWWWHLPFGQPLFCVQCSSKQIQLCTGSLELSCGARLSLCTCYTEPPVFPFPFPAFALPYVSVSIGDYFLPPLRESYTICLL